jgi:hypothetical protein
MTRMYPITTLSVARISLANLERNFRHGRHDRETYAASKAVLSEIDSAS